MAKDYGKWQIVRSLDEGGQARVFLVHDSTDANPERPLFALKRFLNPSRIDRFQREVNVLTTLAHPSIMAIVDVNVASQKPFYVMPYYSRGNARSAGIHNVALEERFAFFGDIISAMVAAHSSDVIHRDLKPENILVTNDGRPVVGDFGICHVEDGQRFTLTEEAAGPRNYTAPEIEMGRQDEVTARSDVYSLGKLLYWLCSGRDLTREYHRREGFDLAKTFEDPRLELITELLDRSVTEDPRKRLEDAKAIQNVWRELTVRFKKTINFPSIAAPQRCIFCGVGKYISPGPVNADGSTDPNTLKINSGITSYNGSPFRAMICDNCGNVQTFRLKLKQSSPNPWAQKSPI